MVTPVPPVYAPFADGRRLICEVRSAHIIMVSYFQLRNQYLKKTVAFGAKNKHLSLKTFKEKPEPCHPSQGTHQMAGLNVRPHYAASLPVTHLT